MSKGVVLLNTAHQEYAWGRKGTDSAVATLKSGQAAVLGDLFSVSPEQSYAELWIGTHPNGPSRVHAVEGHPSLADHVRAHPETLGAKTAAVFGADSLPFLLKVLSVRTALSIQAHPDKQLAEKLHAENPAVYKDPNHKPEMAIAITPFEVLCGFRMAEEIEQHLKSVPELHQVVGGSVDGAKGEELLRKAFCALMEASDETVKPAVAALAARLRDQKARTPLEDAVVRIESDFPGDRGVLCAYLLNHFTLSPGEAVFLGPNLPHAYLNGNCVECMATSDNVVRAGLTPKLRDCATLTAMLEYKATPARPFQGERVADGVLGYYPPVPDFQVEVCTVAETLSLPARHGPSVAIVTSGSGSVNDIVVAEGCAFFVPTGADLTCKGKFTFSLAGVNRSVFEPPK